MYMTKRKERLTVTVDPELVAAGNAAVERDISGCSGAAYSVSCA